jgi:hypothetical protein
MITNIFTILFCIWVAGPVHGVLGFIAGKFGVWLYKELKGY